MTSDWWGVAYGLAILFGVAALAGIVGAVAAITTAY